MSGTPQHFAGEQVDCVALSGGIGGTKLVVGLSRVVDPARLLVVANTGDDFEHLGLHVSPDLDTLTYTLAGLANAETDWGRAGETWTFMTAMAALGGEAWFRLGDGDLATHVERTRCLEAGESLSSITANFCARLGVATRIVPMSDDAVRTIVETPGGPLPVQHYFVREGCRPEVTGFEFAGVANARANPAFIAALADPDLGSVIICPSNPFISVDPILALPGVGAALKTCRAPVIAVSPIVGGQAIKGPTAKMMRELGLTVSATSVAAHYQGLIDGFVLDAADTGLTDQVHDLGLEVLVAETVMKSLDDRIRLAQSVLEFAGRCPKAALSPLAKAR